MFDDEFRGRRGNTRPQRSQRIPEAKENRPVPKTVRRRKSLGASEQSIAPRRALADTTNEPRPPRRERPKRVARLKAEAIFDATVEAGIEEGIAQIEREVASWSIFAKEKTA